jgi:hypothetical protein
MPLLSFFTGLRLQKHYIEAGIFVGLDLEALILIWGEPQRFIVGGTCRLETISTLWEIHNIITLLV